MQTVESLRLLPVWLNPGHLVSTARVIMAGHGLKAVAVLEGERLVGMVTAEGIAALPDEASVRDAMEPAPPISEAATPIRLVAEAFVEQGLERAPVMKGGRYLGIVTASMLLKELRRSWDPLTGLSWSDALRDWGMENLQSGNEIVLLFVDLNDFGAYNKRYGHVVGDKVLQRVAALLGDYVDETSGVLVRYGGDEFAIGIVGEQEDGRELVARILRRAEDLRVPDAEEPVTFCVGVAGGKRSKERENTHYAATLDNLINLASKECIKQKAQRPQSQPEPASIPAAAALPAPNPAAGRAAAQGVKLLSVVAEEHSATALSQVVLDVSGAVVSGVNARMGRPVLESVAIATGKALERGFPGQFLETKAVSLTEGPNGERIVTMLGSLQSNGSAAMVSGARTVGRDLYSAVAEATLEAFFSERS